MSVNQKNISNKFQTSNQELSISLDKRINDFKNELPNKNDKSDDKNDSNKNTNKNDSNKNTNKHNKSGNKNDSNKNNDIRVMPMIAILIVIRIIKVTIRMISSVVIKIIRILITTVIPSDSISRESLLHILLIRKNYS